MRYSQLRAFHAVARLGGFSRAAAAVGLTQPALSDQVRKLEQQYDVLLFDRKRKQIRLTPTGQRLYDILVPMFEQEARAHEFLSESRVLIEGKLRIIADSAYHVTEVIRRFHSRYRAVEITLTSGNSQDVIAALGAYRADIGVLGNHTPHSDLEAVSLGKSRIIAFAHKRLKEAPPGSAALADLIGLPLILREPGSKTRQKLEEAAAAANLVLKPTIEAEGREAVRELVAARAGIGFVSEAEYGHDTRLRRIPLSGTALFMDETVVCIRRRRDLRAIRAFMDIAAQLSGAAGTTS